MTEIIAGGYTTKFGKLPGTLIDLAVEAANGAMLDAGMDITDGSKDKKRISAVYVGNMLGEVLDGQAHLGAAVTSELGMTCEASRAEGACASGGLAVHQAVQALRSGMHETVLVVGVEKMTLATNNEITAALMMAATPEERQKGYSFRSLYAEIAQAHMDKFGTTREHMAAVAIKNHFNACLNENAYLRKEVTEETVLNDPRLADAPLFTKFDACPINDGAAALVLSTRKTGIKKQVSITASAVATDSLGLAERKSLTELAATKNAAALALRQAGITIDTIDVAEVHDCFTIAEILAMEDLGFCEKGMGGRYIASGATFLDEEAAAHVLGVTKKIPDSLQRRPVNTSGGLKACGHPVGATGVKQIVEIRDQLLGRAGKRQVQGARVGLTQNVGGTGATAVVHIMQAY